MALTIVQHKPGTSVASATTVAVTVTALGAGRLLVVACSNSAGRTVVSVTDGTNTYLQVPSCAATANAGQDATDIWWCAVSVSGPTTVTVTFSGVAGTFGKQAEVWEVSGFATPKVDVKGVVNDTNQSNNLDAGASVTTTSTMGFVAGIVRTATSGVVDGINAGNEFTSGGDVPETHVGADSLISSTAAAHQPVWHDSNSFINYCSSTAAFSETPAPPPAQIFPLAMSQRVG